MDKFYKDMTHKNYTKTPRARRLFFWFLVMTFFSITATIIFFSLGYRFSFVSDVFIHAGSLNVKSTPRTVDVIIDGEKPSGRHLNFINDSYHITGIRPGNHDVIFTASGYKPWHKTVSVHSGRATEFWNIILVKNFYERTAYNVKNFSRIFFAPKYDLLVSVQNTTDHSLFLSVTNIKGNQQEYTLHDALSEFNTTSSENIEWSPDTSLLTISIKRTNRFASHTPTRQDRSEHDTQLRDTSTTNAKDQSARTTVDPTQQIVPLPQSFDDYIIAQRAKDGSLQMMYVTQLLPDDFFSQSRHFASDSASSDTQHPISPTAPSRDSDTSPEPHLKNSPDTRDATPYHPQIYAVRFHPKEKNTLYAIIDHDLYLLQVPQNFSLTSPDDDTQVTRLMEDVLTYDLTDDGIFVLTDKGVLFYDKEYALPNPQPLSGFKGVATDQDNHLIAYDRHRVLYLNTASGTLSIYNKKGDQIFSKVIGEGIIHARFSDDGKKVIFHDGHHVRLFMTRPWTTQPAREMNTIYDIATVERKIQNTEWTSDYEHILIAYDQSIALLSLDHRFTHGNEQPVEITTHDSGDDILIADHGKKKIFFTDRAQNITQLFSLDFPQKETGLFQ